MLKKRSAAVLALLLTAWAAAEASETINLEAVYPSPAAIYKRLVTTAKTILARDGGNVSIGAAVPQPPAPNEREGNLTVNDVYLRSSGRWLSQHGGIPDVMVFTSKGYFTVPPGVTRVMVEAWGGGGGGGSSYFYYYASGGGGGGGGYGKGIFNVVPGTTYDVTVGAGGAGAPRFGLQGSPGGASRFGALLTAYGGGGGGCGAWGTIGLGGAGGSSSGGQFALKGASGGDSSWGYSFFTTVLGGSGGSSPNGGGGGVANLGTAGTPGGGGAGETFFYLWSYGSRYSYGYGNPGAPGMVAVWY